MRLTSLYTMLIVYAIVGIASFVYFVSLQSFGTRGLEFSIVGKDNRLTVFDMLILFTLPTALLLWSLSILAYKRKPEVRLFIVSIAFFFFAVKELLNFLDAFFPKEHIYIGNAERALEFLILISFMFLLYKK
jgi:hypothetical protein